MKEYNDRSLIILKGEIHKTFIAFNRPLQRITLDAKAELLAETLSTLAESKIHDFFEYIRANETALPTDGRLKQILRSKPEFSSVKEAKALPYYTDEPAPAKWVSVYMKQLVRVVDGAITAQEAWAIAEAAE